MDVTEVDAALQFSSSVTGSISNIGAHAGTSGGTLSGKTKGISGSVGYEETPTIRYVPLLGSSLTDQLASPISAASIVDLYHSEWPINSIFLLTVRRIGRGFESSAFALNAILALDDVGAAELLLPNHPPSDNDTVKIEVYSGKLDAKKEEKAKTPDNSNALVLSILPDSPSLLTPVRPSGNTKQFNVKNLQGSLPLNSDADYLKEESHGYTDEMYETKRKILHLWLQLLGMYEREQGANCAEASLDKLDEMIFTTHDHDLNWLSGWFDKLPKSIILNEGSTGDKGQDGVLDSISQALPVVCRSLYQSAAHGAAPATIATQTPELMLGTRSAVGVLSYALDVPSPSISIVTERDYGSIREEKWNKDVSADTGYYLLGCSEINSVTPGEDTTCDDINKRARKMNQPIISGNTCNPPPPSPLTVQSIPRDERIYNYVVSTLCRDDSNRSFLMTGATLSSTREEKGYLNAQLQLRLEDLRRLMLIQYSDHEPNSTYIKMYDASSSHWFFIADDDVVSKSNFALLSTIMTIQATAPAQPLTPTIPVGSK